MTKYEKISVLARETAKRISANREEWIRYLDVASRLYKYPFEDQILIYAQRPDATACASLEMWNEKMFCWVNRGAKGIALLDGESERPRLRYVFDVTDVHKAIKEDLLHRFYIIYDFFHTFVEIYILKTFPYSGPENVLL